MITCECCGAPITASKGRIHPTFDFYVADCGDPLCREALSDRARRAFGPLPSLTPEPAVGDHGPMPGALPPSPFAHLTE